jgi:hypothetical protein
MEDAGQLADRKARCAQHVRSIASSVVLPGRAWGASVCRTRKTHKTSSRIVYKAAGAVVAVIVVSITLAILPSFVLAPLVHDLQRIRVPRVIAVVSLVLVICDRFALGSTIASQVSRLTERLPQSPIAIAIARKKAHLLEVQKRTDIRRWLEMRIKQLALESAFSWSRMSRS